MGASGVRGAAWSEWRRLEREDEKQKHVNRDFNLDQDVSSLTEIEIYFILDFKAVSHLQERQSPR